MIDDKFIIFRVTPWICFALSFSTISFIVFTFPNPYFPYLSPYRIMCFSRYEILKDETCRVTALIEELKQVVHSTCAQREFHYKCCRKSVKSMHALRYNFELVIMTLFIVEDLNSGASRIDAKFEERGVSSQ